ncbi:MAG: M42 family metallopeptidase [Thermoplasmatales archaeon]|nr:M42 family metallopeptidase [Thermoplasmatales archaeon]
MNEIIRRLCNAHGISGYEDEIREIIREELQKFVDKIEVDNLGNIIAFKDGEGPSIMLCAHMDEIGLMVKSIGEDGFIKFLKIGGWFDQSLINRRVIIHGEKGKRYGVIGFKPPHIMKEEEKKKAILAEEMFIDTGAKSREEVEKEGVRIGSPITLDVEMKELINNRITGKAIDDRIGIAMMIEAIKRIKNNSKIYLVGTVQEEVGLKGAKTSAYKISPDVAIVCEVAVAKDYPGADEKEKSIKIDGGAVITVVDAGGRGLIVQRNVLKWLEETAKKEGIKYQLEVSEGGTTDATAIHLTKEGIPCGVVSVPTRYMHSGVEMISLNDFEECVKLVSKAIDNLKLLYE